MSTLSIAKNLEFLFLILAFFYAFPCLVFSESEHEASDLPIELGEEYDEYSRVSPGHTSTSRKILLYLPNRVLDAIDILRVDIGIGPALGSVVRVTKWGQVANRHFYPGSLRLGLRGRRRPIFIETDKEIGVGEKFKGSPSRKITPVELGLGLDFFLVGAYTGVSLDEAFDFVLGIFCIDFKEDDIR